MATFGVTSYAYPARLDNNSFVFSKREGAIIIIQKRVTLGTDSDSDR